MMIAALALLLAVPVATPPIGAPRVVVFVNAAGFTAAAEAAAADRALAEVKATGVVPTRLAPGIEATPECLADPACALPLLGRASADWLVAVDVLRAGSRAAVAVRLVELGVLTVDESNVVALDKLESGSAVLLTPKLVARLKSAVAVPTTKTPAAEPPARAIPAKTTPPTTTPTTTTAAPTVQATVPEPPEGELTSMAVISVGVVAVGALLVVGGGAAALGQNAVRLDAGADGDARAATALTIPLALSMAVLGLVGVGAGAGLLYSANEPANDATTTTPTTPAG
ncbi:MAG: hypothetical protein Q8O67_13980 [Deltaproteobacteria bacterium]|nr:hypothetical protein [Deltaproteobacteria bacterium]